MRKTFLSNRYAFIYGTPLKTITADSNSLIFTDLVFNVDGNGNDVILLNYLFKDLISKYSHILRTRGLNFNILVLGGHTSSHKCMIHLKHLPHFIDCMMYFVSHFNIWEIRPHLTILVLRHWWIFFCISGA